MKRAIIVVALIDLALIALIVLSGCVTISGERHNLSIEACASWEQ